MVTATADRVLSVLLVLVGLGVVAAGFYAFPATGQTAYHTQIATVGDGATPANGTVYRFDSLSPNAQRAFLDALDAPDGRATTYDPDDLPQEFRYTDPTDHYVLYKSELYVVRTSRQESWETVPGVAFWLSLLVGVGLTTAGAWTLRRDLHADWGGDPVAEDQRSEAGEKRPDGDGDPAVGDDGREDRDGDPSGRDRDRL